MLVARRGIIAPASGPPVSGNPEFRRTCWRVRRRTRRREVMRLKTPGPPVYWARSPLGLEITD